VTENPNGRWLRLLRRPPRWLIVLVIAVVWAAMQLGLRLLRGKEVAADDVVVYGAFGVALGIFTLWLASRARAKEQGLPPGSPTAANIQKAMSSGHLPEQASAEQWEAELIWTLISDRHMVWVGPLVFGLFTALGVFLMFDQPGHLWFGALRTTLFLSITIGFPFWVRRRRARIQKLLAQLSDEMPSQP
jgi:hypothetical protein